MAVSPHVHISAVHGLAVALFVFALFATLHLLAITFPENPWSRAFTAGAGF